MGPAPRSRRPQASPPGRPSRRVLPLAISVNPRRRRVKMPRGEPAGWRNDIAVRTRLRPGDSCARRRSGTDAVTRGCGPAHAGPRSSSGVVTGPRGAARRPRSGRRGGAIAAVSSGALHARESVASCPGEPAREAATGWARPSGHQLGEDSGTARRARGSAGRGAVGVSGTVPGARWTAQASASAGPPRTCRGRTPSTSRRRTACSATAGRCRSRSGSGPCASRSGRRTP